MITEELMPHLQEEEVPVKIFLTNGTVKYGFVITNDTNAVKGTFSFISSEKIKTYQATKDNCLIEYLYPQAITSIDAFLK